MNGDQYKGTASGKFILLGEHFVVDGAGSPALAFPLKQLTCTVTLNPNHHEHYTFEIAASTGTQNQMDTEWIQARMARSLYVAADALRINIKGQPLHVDSTMTIPLSRGFGSSAAFAVALTRALDAYRHAFTNGRVPLASWEEIQRCTNQIETIYHGTPSGIDTATILAARPIRFEAGHLVRELHPRGCAFVLIDSGERELCSDLIQSVRSFRKERPNEWKHFSSKNAALVDRAEKALNNGDAKGLGSLLNESHQLLKSLNLSSERIEGALEDAMKFGALGGKVSGAGGGGAVVIVAESGHGEALATAMQQVGWSVVAHD